MIKSKSFQKAKYCSELIKNFACCVGFADLYFESKEMNNFYLENALEYKYKTIDILGHEFKDAFRKKVDDFRSEAKKKFGDINEKLYSGEYINDDEIRDFTKFKSSDTLLYNYLMNCVVDVEKDIGDELYRQQLVRDLEDDAKDIKEDLETEEASPILIRLSNLMGGIEKVRKRSISELLNSDAYMQVYTEQERTIEEIASSFSPLSKRNSWIMECQHNN